jgi:hypothetical protein
VQQLAEHDGVGVHVRELADVDCGDGRR